MNSPVLPFPHPFMKDFDFNGPQFSVQRHESQKSTHDWKELGSWSEIVPAFIGVRQMTSMAIESILS
jgi:hypothetical protein